MQAMKVFESLRTRAITRGMPDQWCELVGMRLARLDAWAAVWLTEKEVYLLDSMQGRKRIERLHFRTGCVNRRGNQKNLGDA